MPIAEAFSISTGTEVQGQVYKGMYTETGEQGQRYRDRCTGAGIQGQKYRYRITGTRGTGKTNRATLLRHEKSYT